MYLIEVIQEQIKRAYKKLLMRADTFQFWVVTGGTREERKNHYRHQRYQTGKNRQRLRNSGAAFHQRRRHRENRYPYRYLRGTCQQEII